MTRYMILIERQIGRIALRLQMIRMGIDACVTLSGGERHHLGAVAVAQIWESLTGKDKLSATISNITLPGHKEDELARKAAARLSAALAANVVVCCGIHLDNIALAEINEIEIMVMDMMDELIAAINT